MNIDYINIAKNKYVIAIVFFVIVFFFFLRKKTANNIIRNARKYLGVREKNGKNNAFTSKIFQNRLERIGWYKGAQWCAFFSKLIWLESLTGRAYQIAKKNLLGSSQLTYKRFANDKSGLFVVNKRPKRGAIVVWQSKNDRSRGHHGIVEKVYRNGSFSTIEGNSGNSVKRNKYDKYGSKNSLNLRGFIHVK